MVAGAGLSKSFWAEAVVTAAYLVNRSPHSSINGVPEILWKGKNVSYQHLRVFGCEAYMHIQKENRTKLQERAKRCIFVGYGEDALGYRLWDPETNRIARSRDVKFREHVMFYNLQDKNQAESDPVSPHQSCKVKDESDEEQEEEQEEEAPETGISDNNEMSSEEEQVEEEQPMDASHWVRRSTRISHPPDRYSPSLNYVLYSDCGEPETVREAHACADAVKWKAAMEDEWKSLKQNNTWDLVELPKGRKALHSRWIFRLKNEANGEKRYKARLVVKGFAQKPGIDFTEIFSPVVKHSSIRMVLSLVACLDLELEQLDIKTAFLHGDLEEEIYMHQPEGFINKQCPDFVCRLNKSLYGLKQAPRQWYRKFDTFMKELSYQKSQLDHCVYFSGNVSSKFVILLLYVDDMLIAGNDEAEIKRLKMEMGKHFAMKDLGHAKKILGMSIHRDRKQKKLWLSQSDYIGKVLERFSMKDAKPMSTPLATHFQLSRKDCPSSKEDVAKVRNIPYASAVGSLMYAMVCTRPDIAYAVGVVSRYMSNYGWNHWLAVKWILRYLKGTQMHCLCFGNEDLSLQGFVDANFAADLDSRRSTTGYAFTFGGGAVSWLSRLQPIVTLSTTEAEYVALTEACKEMIWLCRFLGSLGFKQKKHYVFCDSQSAIHLAKNSAFHARTKHIDIRFHFVREIIENKLVDVQKINTKVNVADALTKAVAMDKSNFCKENLGVAVT
eukprot:TRINITY_DN992_c0_g1_i5.p1 TRINITY_DN992_c0_g1~~TRINITY_DN992_c0_g1_i5.p1  ORF type:complete len:816 (+),score=171.97 TRINITY_DN992_c0_g1_i5:277-2448(+)